MLAHDNGTPTRRTSVEGTLIVIVLRNLFTPEFTKLPDSISLQQNVTSAFYTLAARDNDTIVSTAVRSSSLE